MFSNQLPDEERVQAAVVQLQDGLRRIGIYCSDINAFQLEGHIVLAVEADLGDVAFSDRVQLTPSAREEKATTEAQFQALVKGQKEAEMNALRDRILREGLFSGDDST